MEGRGVKLEQRIKPSLCLSCKNARASLCAWVANFTQVWKRAEKKEIVFQSGGTKKRSWVENVMVVRECDHYVPSDSGRWEYEQ